ncbi:MAG TPA: ATP-binding cassette domain-containing protein [Ottowia sp.]|uniref:ABC-F family ATP-binding cassette domain-containing protein n=1 Tax=Ottowia sp. TaxID=1898956 RepID=UPI002C6AF20C|nr:ATP-binding cassette domain-containing protein [Ottowia sp.]HMN22051.1 ATP-binding cassette domain-containing protein [Ottowia sp.]
MIVLNQVTLRRGSKLLLDGASATIHPGEKVGLVGRNGAGKSSLFALLAGTLHEDGGDWSMPGGWQIAEVAQQMPETDASATDFVLAGDGRLSALQARLHAAEQAGDGVAIAQAHSDLQDAGAHDARARAEALILGLGFQPRELGLPVRQFSGGWRMRLQLARALMAPSDLLLLDEPTNHLDLDALIWLEGWLARYPGTLLVISHDRDFLDAVTRVTLHIEAGRLTRYGGNYSAFEEQRAEQLSQQQSAYTRQQEQIAHLQRFIDRFKAKATKARQAQSRIKALERMERVAPVLAEAEFQFEFQPPASLPSPMLVIGDGCCGYAGDPAPTVVLRGIDRTVLAGQRIGILGANGQGKSTLVKTIARELPLLGGTLTEGKGLAIGYFAQQELDVLHAGSTPLEHLVRLARATGRQDSEAAREQQLRNFLGGFNFPGAMVAQPVGSFSGGEKARLVLAMIVWQRPNLLLLDEPTNHLDLATREALALALTEFEGTVMLVSHDRALLRRVCDEFWLVAGGTVQPFEGDLEDYQRHVLEQARQRRDAAASPAGAPAAATEAPALNPAEQRRQQAQRRQQLAARTREHRRALEQAEQRMQAIESERGALEQRLLAPLEPAEIADAGRRLKALQDELAALEDAWLAHSSAIEAMEQSS